MPKYDKDGVYRDETGAAVSPSELKQMGDKLKKSGTPKKYTDEQLKKKRKSNRPKSIQDLKDMADKASSKGE